MAGVISLLSKRFMSIGIAGLGIASEFPAYKSRVENGVNPLLSATQAIGNAVAFTTMGPLPAMLITQGPGLFYNGAKALYAYNKTSNVWQRSIKMPFSHSFTHSDATAQAQQYGMQAIGAGRGFIGSEASMMAARYARR
jgi:hypothetical protein